MGKPVNWKRVLQQRIVARLEDVPQDGRLQIAFVGASNVGKSTLLGALMQQPRLVRTSKRPGCTRQLVFYEIDARFWICDLPGYGYAAVSHEERRRWQRLIEGYLLRHRPYVVVLLDARHAPKATDRQMIAWLQAQRLSWMPVATKADKLSQREQAKRPKELEQALGTAPLFVSATRGLGMDRLRQALASLAL